MISRRRQQRLIDATPPMSTRSGSAVIGRTVHCDGEDERSTSGEEGGSAAAVEAGDW